MSSITIRDIPPAVHRALKSRAERNGRSLQSEILVTLKNAVQPRPVPVEEILARAADVRRSTKVRTTDSEIRRFKKAGRK